MKRERLDAIYRRIQKEHPFELSVIEIEHGTQATSLVRETRQNVPKRNGKVRKTEKSGVP